MDKFAGLLAPSYPVVHSWVTRALLYTSQICIPSSCMRRGRYESTSTGLVDSVRGFNFVHLLQLNLERFESQRLHPVPLASGKTRLAICEEVAIVSQGIQIL